MPDSLKEEEQKVKDEQSTNSPVCDICKKSHDNHLMALCDTCNMHYHIGCLDPPLSKVPKKSAKWGWSVDIISNRVAWAGVVWAESVITSTYNCVGV